MKSLIFGVALGAAAVSMLPSSAQAQVSVSIGQPGFYGRLDIGNFAPAPVLYGPQPVVIAPGPVYGVAPVYLRVPRYQRVSWGRYCAYYEACGIPVLFVRDDWYTRTYVPAYRAYYGPPRGYYGPPPRPYYGPPRAYYGGPRPYVHGVGHPGDWGHGRSGWQGGHHGGWEHGPGPGGPHGGPGPGGGPGHGGGPGGPGPGGGHDHGHR